MAIDNEYKRASIFNISQYSSGPARFAPAVLGEAQNRRQAVGYGYYGILAASPDEEAAIPVRVRIGAHRILGGRGKIR